MKTELFKLSHPEKRELITEQLYPATAFANNPFLLRFKGLAKAEYLETALLKIVETHDALRTQFTQKEGVFYQYVAPYQDFVPDYLDFSDNYGRKRFHQWIDKARNHVFRFTDSRLFYAAILKLPDDEHAIFLNVHHILSDGFTFHLLIHQLEYVYKQCVAGASTDLPGTPSHLQYLDFEKEYKESSAFKRDKSYWEGCFDELPPELVHPMIRSTKANIKVKHRELKLDDQTGRDVLEFCHIHKISYYNLMLGVFSIYMSKVSRNEEIAIGSMTHNRYRPEMKQMAGMFVNAFPFVSSPLEDMKAIDFLKSTNDDYRYILKNHSAYPLDIMMDDLRKKHDTLHNLMNYMLIGQGDYSTELFKAEIHFPDYEQPPFQLILNLFFNDSPGGFRLLYVHPEEAFSKQDIQHIHNQLEALLKAILDKPETEIGAIPFCPQAEKQELLRQVGSSIKPLQDEKTVVDLFRDTAQKFPQNTALVCDKKQITYAELDAKSERIAALLKHKGAQKGEIIAVLSDPDMAMVCGPLAALKAGCAYMPIDHQYPAERVAFMLKDSSCRFILSRNKFLENLSDFDGEIIDLDHLPENIEPQKAESTNWDDPAYIIYTSGSTGKPKGVLIGHRALRYRMDDMLQRIEANETDRFTKFAGFGFDASVFEIFPAILSGAALHILNDDLKRNVKQLFNYTIENQITKSFLPTQFLEQFMEMKAEGCLKIVYTGGDKLQRFTKSSYRVFNFYGPTEACVYATCHEVDHIEDNIPIGEAVLHTRIYILDKHQNPVPQGIAGELCIAGEGLAMEYLNLPEKTKEAFINDPFYEGGKMYRTGDLARYRMDGKIEFLGRIDFQVKIRGFRIEPVEIERVMLQFTDVREVVVVPRKDKNDKAYLCGYFTSSRKIEKKQLTDFLGKALPDYMIPAFLIQLDQMPISTSGKIDRKLLPEPTVERELVPAENGVEEKLLAFWKEILGLEEIGVTENFFDLGGHSLKVTQLQTEIQNFFHADIPFSQLFAHANIREQAILVKSARKVSVDTIERLDARDYYPVSSAQKRLVFWEEMSNAGLMNNIPLIIKLKGKVNEADISSAIDKIIQRHESLRTSFDIINGEAVQIVHDNLRFKKKIKDIKPTELDAYIEDFAQPFDIRKAPLFRIHLLRFSADEYCLLMDFHHAIFDGSSYLLFFNELCAILENKVLPTLHVQYRDFADWQNRIHISDMMQEHEQWWMNLFRDEVPVLDLPTDYPRPAVLQQAGKTYSTLLSKEMSAGIHTFAIEHQITLYPLFVAVFSSLLGRYASKDDLVLGAGMAGRAHVDVQNLIGMFVNTIVLRNKPVAEKSFTDFMLEVQQNFLEAFDHQDYQFERLVEKLKIERDSSRNPLYDVALVYQSMGFPKRNINGLQLTAEELPAPAAHADIMLEVVEEGDQFRLNWEYRSSLYREDTIERMCRHFVQLMGNILHDPNAKIGEYEIVTPTEEQMLLHGFNQTEASWPDTECVHYIIEQHAALNPDHIALTFRDQKMSYGEMNHKANQLAHKLRGMGVKPDDYVGIMMDNSLEMIVSILAILKSGGCYVPMKPDFPADRVRYMLENCGARFMVCPKNYQEKALGFNGAFIDVSDPQLFEGDLPNPEHINKPSDLIYVIYTSGSTGKPKGVMLEHRNITRLFINSEMPYKLDNKDVWSMFHAFSFDFSVWEIFGALLYGARLLIVPKDVIINPSSFLQMLKDEKVTILSQTPGAFYNLIEEDLKTGDHDLAIRYVTFGGEALKPALLADWHKKYPDSRLINMYGITETTVHVTFKEIGDYEIENNISNIGVPIPTLRTYVMDVRQKLMPIGAPGEICVTGDGLARGYLGLPEMTASRFIPNPYLPDEKIYRSGDLARMLPNGEMEYLGRIDFQVKIRGFRIELGEIENRLLTHPDVHECIVLARDDEHGDKYLIAYLETEEHLAVGDIKEFLRKDLPDYMIPGYFICLSKFPMNVNGKVDRKNLPLPDEHIETGKEFVAAQNEVQKKIALAFEKILAITEVSIEDDFFDIGGHSLRAVSLVAELQKDFEVSVNDIFEYRTIEKLAVNIKEKTLDISKKLAQIPEVLLKQAERSMAFEKSEAYTKRMQAYRDHFSRYDQLEARNDNDYRKILLTGTTGYLGVHLLHELLSDGTTEIYVLVRGKDTNDAQNRLSRHTSYYFGRDYCHDYEERLHVLCGDLGQPDLGLGADLYHDLATKLDAVYHPAALVKHYGDIEVFRKNNVEAVAYLLDLAQKSRKKDFHHVSTLSVFNGSVEGRHDVLYTEDDYDSGQQSGNYYAQTKFEAEKLVMDARSNGLNTSIYRIGNVSVNSRTGKLQSDVEGNAFYSVLKAYVNIGAVPQEFNEVEFAWVNELAASIVLLSKQTALNNACWHLWNTNKIQLADVLSDKKLNLNIEPMDFEGFAAYLARLYDVTAFKPHIEKLLLHMGWIDLLNARPDEVLKEITIEHIISERTDFVLHKLGFVWPANDAALLRKMLIQALAERMAFMRQENPFGKISEELAEALAPIMRRKYYKEGEDVLWENEKADHLNIIEDGYAELSRHSATGWLGTIGLSQKGGMLGLESLTADKRSAVIAEAILSGITLYEVDNEKLKLLMQQNPAIAMHFIDLMGDSIRKLERMIVNLG